jgi:hypothetical protein
MGVLKLRSAIRNTFCCPSRTPSDSPFHHRTPRAIWCLGLTLAATLTSPALAQPARFHDLGTLTAPATPPSEQEAPDLSSWFEFGDGQSPGEIVTVKWARFTLGTAIAGDLFLDVSAYVTLPSTPVLLALYDGNGDFIASNESNGSAAGGAGLTFGSPGERVPFTNPPRRGDDGASLPAGEYWLALAAGPGSLVTFGTTNWEVSTSASFEAGFDESQTYGEATIWLGNTTFPAAPANDDCANAVTVGEDVGNTPAWVGTNIGATPDGFGACDFNRPGITEKDVWISYVPSQTGWAQIVVGGGAGGGAVPIITKHSAGCVSFADRCVGGGIFAEVGGSRMAFQTQAGVPILFRLSVNGGQWGPLTVNIDLLNPPCNLNTPPGAVVGAEPCGTAQNNGCNASPVSFGSIELGQTVTGTLFNTLSSQDADWYQFTTTELLTVTIAFKSQLSATAAIIYPPDVPGACSGIIPIFRRTPDFLNPCTTQTASGVLEPGTYWFAITHLHRDGFNCSSGYNGYWMALTGVPCDRATIDEQPASTTACPGSNATFAASMTSAEEITYFWQWAFVDDDFSWTNMVDGEFSDVFSTAVVAGADTPTLTLSGLDEAAASVRFRLLGTTCGVATTGQVRVTLRDAAYPACVPCPGDYDGNGLLNPDDLADFIAIYFAGC